MGLLKKHLVIFAKAPRIGYVKTRLAKDIGHVQASMFYRFCLRNLIRKLSLDNRWKTWVAITPDGSPRYKIIPARVEMINQGNGCLGKRIMRVMSLIPRGPLIIIGSDIPNIESDIIDASFKSLKHNDAVIGPARDGGYWLIGYKKTPKSVETFSGVRWSTTNALNDTIDNMNRLSLTFSITKELEDIDDIGSFNRWKQTLKQFY